MKFFNPIRLLLTLCCLLTLLSGVSLAALQAVGPINPVTTLPSFYQDTEGLALQICTDQNGRCILPPPFDAIPVTDPITTTGPVDDTNFPEESFYYFAAASVDIEGGADTAVFEYVLEAAFLAGVEPGTGTTFLRTDLQKMGGLPANTNYRVTHPYGTFDFATDANGDTINGGGAIRFEDQAGVAADYFPPGFQAAPITNMGPFLTPADGILPTELVNGETHTYLGDAATAVPVTGGTNGNTLLIERLDGPNGNPVAGASWQTDLWILAGRVFTDQIPSPMTINRATYASDGASGQFDVFVTATTGATVSIAGTGISPTALTQDTPNTGKFFAHFPLGATVPTDLVMTNSLDTPAIDYPIFLVDEVNISRATYNPDSQILTVQASSRDTMSPLPTLTVPAFAVEGNPSANTLDATGTVEIDLSATIPPQTVQVASSQGGIATAPVSVANDVSAPASITVPASSSTGSFTVSWAASATAGATYTLEESTDNFATTSTEVTSGSIATSAVISGKTNGTYYYRVKAVNSPLLDSAWVTGGNGCVVTIPPITSVSFAMDPASPATVGSLVNFTAIPTGGATVEYQLWAYDYDGAVPNWTLVDDWTTNPVLPWDTSAADGAGQYNLQVRARNVGSTAAWEARQFFSAYFLTADPPVTGAVVNVTAATGASAVRK